MIDDDRVCIYSDGSCLGNPGPGGYGIVIVYRGTRKELSKGFRYTTNNRMEMLAAIVGLKALKRRCSVVVTSDSEYLRKGITQWIDGWKRNGWKTSAKKPVKNADLWRMLDELSVQHSVKWEWVKGHAGHAENERCDHLARDAAATRATEVDTGYERDCD